MNTTEKKKRIKEIEAILNRDDLTLKLKTQGDLHIQNVFRFFNRWVSKSDPLRDTVKGIVFG
jgi:hypothetical protein